MPIIRLASPDDAAVVAALVASAYGHYVARLGRKPAPMLNDYAAQIEVGSIHLLCEGATIMGLCVLVSEDDALFLENIAVDPRFQKHGHGGRLLDFAEDQTRARGLPRLRLCTNVLMTENLAIYAHRGFVETGRGMQGQRVDMSKPIT